MKKCSFCNNQKVSYHVTELKSGKVTEMFDMCDVCGTEYMQSVTGDLEPKKRDATIVDITHISTPEQLLALMNKLGHSFPTKPCCPGCKLTVKEFEQKGRFGCQQCYDHFKDEFEAIVVPYQHADEHVGKRPKNTIAAEETLEEKIKTAKLKLAKASEIENYELAAVLKKELEQLTNPSP